METFKVLAPRLVEGTQGVLRQLDATFMTRWTYEEKPLYSKRPGQTGVGQGSFRAALLGGSTAAHSNVLRRNTSSEELFQDCYKRAARLVETIVFDGSIVRIPVRLIRLLAYPTDFALGTQTKRQEEKGEFSILQEMGEEETEDDEYIPLHSVGDCNNDSKPYIPGEGLTRVIYLVRGTTKRLYQQIVSTDALWENDDGSKPLIVFFFGTQGVYRENVSSLCYWMPTSMFFPRERGSDLKDCFKINMRSDNCAGAFDLGLSLISLRIQGISNLVTTMIEPITLPQIKTFAMPDLKIIVDTYGDQRPVIGEVFSSVRIASELCYSLDRVSFLRDPVPWAELDEDERASIKAMMNSNEVGKPLGMPEKELYEWPSVISEMPESLGSSENVDLMFQRTRGLSASVITHDYPISKGRLPLRQVVGEARFSSRSEEFDVLLHSRCMDALGGRIQVEGARIHSLAKNKKKKKPGLSEMKIRGYEMTSKHPAGAIPGVTLSGGMPFEVSLEMKDFCEEAGRLLSQEGVSLILADNLNIARHRVRRWVVPVSRDPAPKMSQILSRPTTQTNFFRACGLPLLVLSEIANDHLEEEVARANSLAIRAASLSTMQFEVQHFFEYNSGRMGGSGLALNRPIRELFGIPINYIRGTGVFKIIREKNSLLIETSEKIYVKHEEAQKKIFARILLTSDEGPSDEHLSRIYGNGLPMVSVGRIILEYASFRTKVIQRSFGSREISPYEGVLVKSKISPWVLPQEFRSAYSIPMSSFGSIDSEGTEKIDQLYTRLPNEKIAIALPFSVEGLELKEPRDLMREKGPCFSREKTLRGEESFLPCVIAKPRLQGDMEIDFQRVKPEYAVDSSEIYELEPEGSWKTGDEMIRKTTKNLNVWAARAARAMGVKLIAKEKRGNGLGEFRMSDRDGDNYFMSHPRMGACRYNWMKLLFPEKIEPEVEAWLEGEMHPNLKQHLKTKNASTEVLEAEEKWGEEYRPESDDRLRKIVEDGKRKLDLLHHERQAQKEEIIGMFENWTSGDNEMKLARFGYERTELLSVIGEIEPTEMRFHLVSEGEVDRSCLDTISKQLVQSASNDELERRELGEWTEIKTYWTNEGSVKGWRINPLAQANALLARHGLAAFEYEVKEKNSAGGNKVYFEATTVHPHPIVPHFSGVGGSKKEAKSDACKRFILSFPDLNVPKAPKRNNKFEILNADWVDQLESYSFIAFDCEFDSDREKIGAATCISLAVGNVSILWVRGGQERPPKWLKRLFENPDVIKYGFEMGNDLKSLRELGIECVRTKDLRAYRKQKGFGEIGLKDLSAYLVGIVLTKGEVTMSFREGITWEELSDEQKSYAGGDAIATLRIAEMWENKRSSYKLLRQEEGISALLEAMDNGVPIVYTTNIIPFLEGSPTILCLLRTQIPRGELGKLIIKGKGMESLVRVLAVSENMGGHHYSKEIANSHGVVDVTFEVVCQRVF